MLVPSVPYNRFDFEVKADTSFRKGDTYLLSFDTNFIYQSGSKDAVLRVQSVGKGRLLNESQRRTELSMVVLVIQIVTLFHGINQLDVIVLRMATSSLKRKSRVVNRLSVPMGIIKKKFRSKNYALFLPNFT